MSEDIRQIHYDAWAKGKKFMPIEVKQTDDGQSWMGTCKRKFGFVVYRDTKQQVIYAMATELHKRGYEIGNLPEVTGVV